MRSTSINEFVEGLRVDQVFHLRSREMRSARTGEAYLALEFGDHSGAIGAVYFRPTAAALAVPVGSAARVRGSVTRFRGLKRLSVETLEAAESWDPAELIGTSTRAIDELREEFNSLARTVSHRGLRRLLRTVFHNEGTFGRFCACPASREGRRAYISGLIEHTVAVASLCEDAANRYEGIDHDLLLSAALLHDVGMLDTLTFDTGIGLTDEGRLIGHQVLGVLRIRRAAEGSGLEQPVLTALEHVVLAHHGEGREGSVAPMTLEALVLSQSDAFDAQVAGFASAIRHASLIEEDWTDSGNAFGRPLLARRLASAADSPDPRLSAAPQAVSAA